MNVYLNEFDFDLEIFCLIQNISRIANVDKTQSLQVINNESQASCYDDYSLWSLPLRY